MPDQDLDSATADEIQRRVEGYAAEILASADFPEIWNKLKAHDKVLHGNGRPGLVENVAAFAPLAKQIEEHLKSFKVFELDTKLDQQKVHSAMDNFEGNLRTIQENIRSGFEKLELKIKPLEDISGNLTRILVGVAVLSAIGGAIIVTCAWMAENWSTIRSWFKS